MATELKEVVFSNALVTQEAWEMNQGNATGTGEWVEMKGVLTASIIAEDDTATAFSGTCIIYGSNKDTPPTAVADADPLVTLTNRAGWQGSWGSGSLVPRWIRVDIATRNAGSVVVNMFRTVLNEG